ncbi:MAG: transglutaminase domain-containing protein [Nitrospira sp.]|nr:transglutaminase domain-containing protein [Nitrospira sp.]
MLANYRYNLDVPSLQSAHPLEDFLLTRKTGYCEHYATAMVVLLRATGIPARLVTGFLATEWNEFSRYYTVRQRDAHAWVEVYFPRSGWITMDPTPPAPENIGQTWWQSADRVMDSVRLQWDRLFVHFSANDQLTVVQGIREGGKPFGQNSPNLSTPSRPRAPRCSGALHVLVHIDRYSGNCTLDHSGHRRDVCGSATAAVVPKHSGTAGCAVSASTHRRHALHRHAALPLRNAAS